MNVRPESAFALMQVFSRVEFALNQLHDYIDARHGALPRVDWDAFHTRLEAQPSGVFADRIEHEDRTTLLGTDTGGPPERMRVRERDGRRIVRFSREPLSGNTELQQVMDAAKRVRNNLVHGGKERYEQQRRGYPEHDQALVEAATRVMETASRAIDEVRALCWDD